MKLGLFLMPLHPVERSMTELFKEDADKIIYADQLGFDQAWVGEHITSLTENIPSPLMFMAALINQTKKIKFATGVACPSTVRRWP